MRRFGILLSKETRELVTPQIVIPFLVIIAMFFLIGEVIGREGEKAESVPVGVIDLDGSAQARTVIAALPPAGFSVRELAVPAGAGPDDLEAIVDGERGRSGVRLILAIPPGFGAGIESGVPQELISYTVMRDFSFFATVDAGRLRGAVAAVNESASDALMRTRLPGVDPVSLKLPVFLQEHVYVGDRTAQAPAEEVVGFISSQTTFIPIVLFVVIIIAAQMIATAVAAEKENKTLETLLSAPIGRVSLVAAKMVAAAIVALATAIVYIASLRYYLDGVMGGLGPEVRLGMASAGLMEELGLTLGVYDYALLGLTLFLGILVALAIAVVLGALADSVKAVQAMLTPLMAFIMIPYFLTLMVDLSGASVLLRSVVLAIPFSHPFMAAPNLFFGEYSAVWYGIAYQSVWFAGCSYLAARIFASDRILTMRLRFGRGREAAA